MSRSDTIRKTFIVAIVLSLVCAVVVSTAAVLLRPLQEQNREADIQRNILDIAGLFKEGENVQEQFEHVETRMINFETGTYTDEVDPDDYDQLAAARDPQTSNQVARNEDIASISRQEKYGKVYEVRENDQLQTIILPIRGYGLWGTLYGFIALEAETFDVVGLGFYEHKETPGLGGEVDNPRWKQQWTGKRIYSDNLDSVDITVVKGEVDQSDPEKDYKVQGLTGATLTARGVQNMLDYWMGDKGYAEFLRNLKAGEA